MKAVKTSEMNKLFDEDHKVSRKNKVSSKLGWFDQLQGYIALVAMAAGDVRAIQLESGTQWAQVALGGLFLFFAVSAVVKLINNR